MEVPSLLWSELGSTRASTAVLSQIAPAPGAVAAAQALPEGAVYLPDEAPRLPLPTCPQGRRCPCVYRPVMNYEEAVELSYEDSAYSSGTIAEEESFSIGTNSNLESLRHRICNARYGIHPIYRH